jgi:predicted Ser/Thr protein kinase
MGNPFEERIRNKIETKNKSEAGESNNNTELLIAEFPEALQERLYMEVERLYKEVEGFDENSAEEYLIQKLVARRESLVEWSIEKVSQFAEVTHDVPLGVIESIQNASEQPDEKALGEGKNGRSYPSVRKAYACYKVLFLQRARELGSSVVREAVFQHEMGEIVKQHKPGARIPEVLGFVEHPDILAIMMERIKGNSLLQIFEGKGELPSNFDVDSFFDKLEATVDLLNEYGYFHRDLTNNSGNVMVDEEGNPWLIDFGSATKALNPDIETQTYQLHPGGGYMRAKDRSGVRQLKEKVIDYLKKQEREKERA